MLQEKMSRRRLLKMAGVGIGGTLLAACQPEVVKETVVVEKEVEGEVVKETVEVEREVTRVVEKEGEPRPAGDAGVLRVHWRLGNERAHYPDVIAQFEETHPDTTVTVQSFPAGSAEYGPKLATLIAGGAAGDLTWSAIGSGSFQFFAQYGALASLEEMIAAEDQDLLDAYFPRVVEGFRMGPGGQGTGDLYGIPEIAHGTYQFLFYNQDLLEEMGLSTPTVDDDGEPSWIREDLLNVAIDATDAEARRFGFLPQTGGYSEIRHTTRAFGGELMSDDGTESLIESDQVKAATRWLYDSFHDDEIAPPPAEQAGGVGQMFLGERLAMWQSGAWTLATLKSLVGERFNWDMMLMPPGPADDLEGGEGLERGGHLHADAYCVLQDSQMKQEAYEFCKMMGNEEFVRRYAVDEFGLTCRFDTYEDEEAREAQPYWRPISKSIEEAGEHLGPANLRKQECQTTIASIFDPLWTGDAQSDDAWFAEASAEFQDFLNKSPE